MLCHCDIASHSTAVMLRQFGIDLSNKGVYHLGAHDGIEANIYDHFGAKYVVWVEANKLVYPYLQQRLGGRKNHYSFLAALDEVSNREVEFYFYRETTDGASGMYLPDKMFDYIKDCPLVGESVKMTTITVDDLIAKYNIPYMDCHFMNVDLQGAELRCLKGAQLLLNSPNLQYIWCEVSWDKCYQGGPLLEDIDKYLNGYQFKRIHLRQDWEIQGDALYVRT